MPSEQACRAGEGGVSEAANDAPSDLSSRYAVTTLVNHALNAASDAGFNMARGRRSVAVDRNEQTTATELHAALDKVFAALLHGRRGNMSPPELRCELCGQIINEAREDWRYSGPETDDLYVYHVACVPAPIAVDVGVRARDLPRAPEATA